MLLYQCLSFRIMTITIPPKKKMPPLMKMFIRKSDLSVTPSHICWDKSTKNFDNNVAKLGRGRQMKTSLGTIISSGTNYCKESTGAFTSHFQHSAPVMSFPATSHPSQTLLKFAIFNTVVHSCLGRSLYLHNCIVKFYRRRFFQSLSDRPPTTRNLMCLFGQVIQ